MRIAAVAGGRGLVWQRECARAAREWQHLCYRRRMAPLAAAPTRRPRRLPHTLPPAAAAITINGHESRCQAEEAAKVAHCTVPRIARDGADRGWQGVCDSLSLSLPLSHATCLTYALCMHAARRLRCDPCSSEGQLAARVRPLRRRNLQSLRAHRAANGRTPVNTAAARFGWGGCQQQQARSAASNEQSAPRAATAAWRTGRLLPAYAPRGPNPVSRIGHFWHV